MLFDGVGLVVACTNLVPHRVVYLFACLFMFWFSLVVGFVVFSPCPLT